MSRIQLKTPFLWLLFFLWVAWGQLVSYCVLNGLIPNFILGIADAIVGVVPSITRLDDNYAFGFPGASRIAARSLAMTPLLILLMLLADVEENGRNLARRSSDFGR